MTQIEKDISEVIENSKYFKDFENTSILVTGSTGLIGSILIKSLLSYSKKNNTKITIYANCRNEKKFISVFNTYLCENLIPLYSDVQTLDLSDISVDYIIHGASITDSKTFVQKPVETILTAIDGTRNILNQLINKKIKGFVYLSSLEVYGSFPESNNVTNVTENIAGYIDTLSVRSSYSESKRMVETLCISYATEYNLPIKIARLCQTFGAGVEYNDNRVFAQFARCVIENNNIILKTKGETVRNYCYTTDAVTGLLTVLSKGETANAYNIANSNTTISILKMAELCCSINNKIQVIFDIQEDATKLGYNPVVKLQLDTTKLESQGWKAKINIEEMFTRLIQSMKASM